MQRSALKHQQINEQFEAVSVPDLKLVEKDDVIDGEDFEAYMTQYGIWSEFA